jgi:hypothetical protein
LVKLAIEEGNDKILTQSWFATSKNKPRTVTAMHQHLFEFLRDLEELGLRDLCVRGRGIRMGIDFFVLLLLKMLILMDDSKLGVENMSCCFV